MGGPLWGVEEGEGDEGEAEAEEGEEAQKLSTQKWVSETSETLEFLCLSLRYLNHQNTVYRWNFKDLSSCLRYKKLFITSLLREREWDVWDIWLWINGSFFTQRTTIFFFSQALV